MIRVLWKYQVKDDQVTAFVREYGLEGSWYRLFAGKPGFIGTELVRGTADGFEFVTIDTWESNDLYQVFLREHAAAYREVDSRCEGLTECDMKIGVFETLPSLAEVETGSDPRRGLEPRDVFVYVFDTMADWEPAYLLPELNTGRFLRRDVPKVRVFALGLDRRPIRTMGGLCILPDLRLDEVPADGMAALILPGGDTWFDPVHEPIFTRVRECLEKGILVGALCGATMALASRGFLDSRPHTSNDLRFLKQACPTYVGEAHYVNEPCVLGDHLVTASGLAPQEFARVMFEQLDVLLPATREALYQLHTTRNPRFFHDLMASLPPRES